MKNPFPLSPSVRWAIAAWMIYLISYTFLAGFAPDLIVPGHTAATYAYCETYKQLFTTRRPSAVIDVLDHACPIWTLSNFLMLTSPLLLLWHRRVKFNALSWVFAVSALSPMLAFFSIKHSLQFLDKGFYLWWLSFGMIAVAFFLAKRMQAVALENFQFGVDTLIAVTVAAGLVLGLNLQHFQYCMTAFEKETFKPVWIIPCQIAASLLALVLFFDLWEAHRRRAEAAAK